jgi:hypothetical protein
MVLSPSSLASTLTEDTPEQLIEDLVVAKRREIKAALEAGQPYELTDDEGRVFMIKPKHNGK